MEAQALASTGSHHPPRPDGDREKDKEGQPQGLVPGGAVVVLSGPYRGLYGKVRNQHIPEAIQVEGKIALRVQVGKNCG